MLLVQSIITIVNYNYQCLARIKKIPCYIFPPFLLVFLLVLLFTFSNYLTSLRENGRSYDFEKHVLATFTKLRGS